MSPDYLAASGRRIVQGHFIDDREIASEAHEVVITEDFAARYFAGENVLGRVIHLPDLLRGDAKTALKDDSFTVVGVMQNIPTPAFITEALPNVFLPYSIIPRFAGEAVISTALPAGELANPMRGIVHTIDRDQPVTDVMSLGQMLDMYGYASPRFTLALFGTFAVAALLLSLVGIYGVLSFITSQRTQEIGIRMALGAQRGKVMWMVLRQACILAVCGVVLGLPLAFFAGRFAKDQLVKTSQHDPLALIAAICVLPLLAIAGTWIPARRAAAIDPVRALRAD